jgi:hypothetical protein
MSERKLEPYVLHFTSKSFGDVLVTYFPDSSKSEIGRAMGYMLSHSAASYSIKKNRCRALAFLSICQELKVNPKKIIDESKPEVLKRCRKFASGHYQEVPEKEGESVLKLICGLYDNQRQTEELAVSPGI